MGIETQSDQSTGNIEGLVRQLGLRAYDKELFIGKIRGFPVGIKFIGTNESLLLLCQIRYPVDAEVKGIRVLGWGDEVDKLVAEKKVEISVEDKIAWLTIPDSGSLIKSNSVTGILDAVLTGLEKAGLAGLLDKCHYCQIEPVQSLTCRDGKVAQICEACLAGKSGAQASDLRVNASGVGKALVLGGMASIVGALAWALIWMGHARLFEFLNVKRIFVPRILELIVMVGVGFCVGGPVGFILKKIPNRGDLLAGWLAVAFAIASIVLGEILFVSWFVYNAAGIISFSLAIRIVPRYLGDSGVLYIIEKMGFGFVSVVVAYQMARPKKKGIKL